VKLLLVDGYYYAYRSFHALPGLTNPAGQPTGAVYGFLKSLRRMLKDLAPARAAVVWDEGLPERRTALQPEYKAQRAEMPETLEAQLELMREMITLLGFISVSIPNTEADDLMASYALAARAKGWDCVIATADKDLFQIVGPDIRVYSTNKTDLKTPQDGYALLNEDRVLEKWGVLPEQLGDILAIVGDSADNIPGIAGIGPKGASALISKWGSLTGIYENIGSVGSEKLIAKLVDGRARIFENREMVRLDEDLPLPTPIEALHIAPMYEALIPALERCGFKSLRQEMLDEMQRISKQPAATVNVLRQGDLFG
jgi:DNA polymerase-1